MIPGSSSMKFSPLQTPVQKGTSRGWSGEPVGGCAWPVGAGREAGDAGGEDDEADVGGGRGGGREGAAPLRLPQGIPAPQRRCTKDSSSAKWDRRKGGWNVQDFGDGGAFPEIHYAQFPLEMGRSKERSTSNTLALTLDGEGKVRYDAIARQGHGKDKVVYSRLEHLKGKGAPQRQKEAG